MINPHSLQKVRELPIEQVAEALGLQVKRHRSLCPFHDDSTPSLTYHVRKNTYRCFACDAHGSPIDLAMHQMRLDFADSVRYLAQSFGILIEDDPHPRHFAGITPRQVKPVKPVLETESKPDIQYLNQLVCQPYLTDEARHFLFAERKLHPAVVRWLGVSSLSSAVPMSRASRSPWFHAPALLIPYRDLHGQLLTVQTRYLGKEGKPRFQFPKGSKCSIFNLPVLRLLKESEELWITEGVTDCMAMLSAGRKAIAIPSATLLKAKDLESIRLATINVQRLTLHMVPDNDEPGERLYLQLKELFPQLIRHSLPESYKDFGEYYMHHHPESLATMTFHK